MVRRWIGDRYFLMEVGWKNIYDRLEICAISDDRLEIRPTSDDRLQICPTLTDYKSVLR
jgi:hypothetical protein